jgi:hypothetical protein
MAGPMDVTRHNRFNGYMLGDGVSAAATGTGFGSSTDTSGVH